MGEADAWYDGPAWDDGARAEFERRLARARAHNRPQYLRIKAIALRDAGETTAAASLLHRVVDLAGDGHEATFAIELLGDLAASEGDRVAAEALYGQVLDRSPDLDGTSGTVDISLAECLVARRAHDEAHERLLAYPARPGMRFDFVLFRWHLGSRASTSYPCRRAAGCGAHRWCGSSPRCRCCATTGRRSTGCVSQTEPRRPQPVRTDTSVPGR